MAAHGRGLAGAALDRTVRLQIVHAWVQNKAKVITNISSPKGWRLRRLCQPTLEGGGADLAGVRALVPRCAHKPRDHGKVMLTTQRRRR
jgi:hypothetical protein